MRYAIGCFCSAVLGGLAAAWLLALPARERLSAEERTSGASTVLVAAPRGPMKPRVIDTSSKKEADGRSAEVDESIWALMTPDERVNVLVYERVNKSVVHITTKSVKTEGWFSSETAAEGAGSGSVLDKAGHLLTNYHVVGDAQQVTVNLHDGKSYDATFVGADAINDVAVIKIDAPEEVLYPVSFGDSSILRVGMRVFAIGNPFGLERTLTTGIISSLNRSLQIHRNHTIKSIIQIDAAINPGNSGGPLLDARGQLIGINTAIASKTGQSAGVGFAIPVNLIARIVPQLIAKGHVVRPEVGISRVYQTERGLAIAQMIPKGPAERAGLRGPKKVQRRRGPFTYVQIDPGTSDLIVGIDDKKIKTAEDFLDVIESKQPGDQVTLTIIREGKEIRVPIRLDGTDDRILPPEGR